MALLTTDTEPDKASKPDNTADALLGLGVRRLLDCLRQRGFHLRIDGNELEVLYPPGAMSASLHNMLTQRRDELIELGTGVPVAISDVRLSPEWETRMLTIVRHNQFGPNSFGQAGDDYPYAVIHQTRHHECAFDLWNVRWYATVGEARGKTETL